MRIWRDTLQLQVAHDVIPENGAVQGQVLDSMILVGVFQLGMICHSLIM